MTDFNPLAGAILGSAQAQQAMGTEKQRQVRRAQVASKNAGASGDRFEHEVESVEELHPVQDEEQQDQRKDDSRKRRQDQDEPEPHIDVKA